MTWPSNAIMKQLLAWTVLLAFAAACDSAERSASPSEPIHAQTAMQDLDPTHPTATQPISAADATKATFVEVHVVHVENPSLASISFTVAYEARAEKIPLGSFALYPANRPGTFIVPTQQKIRATGAIVVTMENPDKDPHVRVTIGTIKLITHPSVPNASP
jgi:hypothetical protein